MEKLTVLITCKNEEKHIKKCIESVIPLSTDILVADSGSTDNTLNIIKSFKQCRLIEREYLWDGSFRSWAIKHVLHDWVLIIDADERATDELIEEIKNVLKKPQYEAYFINFKTYFLGHELKFGGSCSPTVRLFNKEKGKHELIKVHAGFKLFKPNYGKLKFKFLHYSIHSHDQWLQKTVNYTNWSMEQKILDNQLVSSFRLFVEIPLQFIRRYFLRLGFLDGKPGLLWAWSYAYYSYLKQAKLWEKYNLKEEN